MNLPPPVIRHILLEENKNIDIKDQVFFQTGNDGVHQWESGIVLARFVLWAENLHGKILELGSGSGLAGITCSKYRNFEEVVLTDYNERVIANMTENAALNHARVSIKYMDWTNASTYLDTRFDFIIGSDLIYDGAPIRELIRTIAAHLAQTGSCYIIMPNKRKMTPVFITEIEQAGLQVESSPLLDERYRESPSENKAQGYRDFIELQLHTYILYTIKFNNLE
ncbi:unnamed protein product [Blepharisma stoltei]|uniref:Calmodulin-lysine N-methyltransferase n=1 Tax=Blepharisma stoltei TaxID=1481888 RepID=A0AAU9J488_9CILI|nr:unnamed protein product [Blepharisma stoltei]